MVDAELTQACDELSTRGLQGEARVFESKVGKYCRESTVPLAPSTLRLDEVCQDEPLFPIMERAEGQEVRRAVGKVKHSPTLGAMHVDHARCRREPVALRRVRDAPVAPPDDLVAPLDA